MAGKKQNLSPTWKNLMNRFHFLTTYTWDVFNVNVSRTKSLFFDEYRKLFESRVAAGATENLTEWEKPHANTVAWSHDIEGRAQTCVERYCELANIKVEQFFKVSSLCLDDDQFKQEELESVGEL